MTYEPVVHTALITAVNDYKTFDSATNAKRIKTVLEEYYPECGGGKSWDFAGWELVLCSEGHSAECSLIDTFSWHCADKLIEEGEW